MRNFNSSWKILSVFFLTITFISYLLRIYEITYVCFSFFLLSCILFYKNINIKVLGSFYFLYFAIPFLNISNYRGIIEFNTIQVYTLFISLSLLPFIFKLTKLKRGNSTSFKNKRIGFLFTYVALIHIIIVYIVFFYVNLKNGFIFLNQDARFSLSTTLSYIIKSSLYLSLFFPFLLKSQQKRISNILLFFILPVMPAFLLGSRGSIILVFISVGILMLLKSQSQLELLQNDFTRGFKRHKNKLIALGFLGIIAIYVVFYLRRSGSGSLASVEVLLEYYFPNYNIFTLLILPLYTTLRETVGIANKIIVNDLTNIYLPYPMFFAEMITILPGTQPAPGQILAKKIIGASADGGLTPGIIGGLYLDFKYWCLVFPIAMSLGLKYLYLKAINSDFYKLMYVLSITQFVHLYHRGFLKIEYVMGYVIVIMYAFLLKKENL